MRKCPFPNCDTFVPDDRFACITHWRMLNKDSQSRIWAAYKAYQSDKLPLEALRRVQEEVLADFNRKGATHQPCSTCFAPVIWAVTGNKRRVPVDAQPVEKGNIVLRQGVAVYLNGDMFDEEAKAKPGEPLYVSHFVTCPDAVKHRKKRS